MMFSWRLRRSLLLDSRQKVGLRGIFVFVTSVAVGFKDKFKMFFTY